MAFGFMTPQAYMAKKQGGDAEIAADVPEADVAETVEEPPPPAGVQKPTCTAALVDETSLFDAGAGMPDFGGMAMMEEVPTCDGPPAVEISAFGGEAESMTGIGVGRRRRKKKVPGADSSPPATPTAADVAETIDPAEAARLQAEAEEAAARAAVEAEAARIAAEQEASRVAAEHQAAQQAAEVAIIAVKAEAARIAAEEEAARLAALTVSSKMRVADGQLAAALTEQAKLLLQCARTRKAVISDRTKLTNMEAEVEEATGSEDYDRAERIQNDIDILRARLASAQQQLAATQVGLQEANAAKNNMLSNAAALHGQRVEELRTIRSETLATCAAFIGEHGARLNSSEDSLKSIAQQVTATSHAIQAEIGSSDKLEAWVNKQVAEKTVDITAQKVSHEANVTRIDEEIAELLRQVEVKREERQTETEGIEAVDAGVESTRQIYAKELGDIVSSRQTIQRQEAECETKTYEIEAQWPRLEKYRKEVDAQRDLVVAAINENCKDEDAVQKNRSLLTLWLGVADEDEQLEQAATEKEALLKEQLARARAELRTLSASNSAFADGMRRLQTEATQLQKTKQRCDQMMPALENEKASAAKARNFKEASRLNSEIKAVQLEAEETEAKLVTLNATIAAKHNQNADLSEKLTGLSATVDKAEKAVNVGRFDYINALIGRLSARVAAASTSSDETNQGFFQVQLDVAKEEADDLAKRYAMSTSYDSAYTVDIPSSTSAIAEVVELPKPIPRMSEAEAAAIIQGYASKSAELECQLEEAMDEEDYDKCDGINEELDALKDTKGVADELLGDRAKTVGMSEDEATEFVASYDTALPELEAKLGAAMEAEDYDLCDTVSAQVDALKTKKVIADGVVKGGSGGSPVNLPPAAVSDVPLVKMTILEVPEFELPSDFSINLSSVQKAQEVSASASAGFSFGSLGGNYGSNDASAGGGLYGSENAPQGGFDFANQGGGGGGNYSDDVGAAEGVSMYADPTGGGIYGCDAPDEGGGFDFVKQGVDTAAGDVCEADAGVGSGVYGSTHPTTHAAAGGAGFDFMNQGGDAGAGGGIYGGEVPDSAAMVVAAGGFDFVNPGVDAGAVECASMYADSTGGSIYGDDAVTGGRGFDFVDQVGDAAAGDGIYGSDVGAAEVASMYTDPTAGGIYGGEAPASGFDFMAVHGQAVTAEVADVPSSDSAFSFVGSPSAQAASNTASTEGGFDFVTDATSALGDAAAAPTVGGVYEDPDAAGASMYDDLTAGGIYGSDPAATDTGGFSFLNVAGNAPAESNAQPAPSGFNFMPSAGSAVPAPLGPADGPVSTSSAFSFMG
jgi:hypothetical protein